MPSLSRSVPPRPRARAAAGLLCALALAAAPAAAGTTAGDSGSSGTPAGDAAQGMPRFEISVNYVANLVHWVDNLAGSSGGKTIRTYRRFWQLHFGSPTPHETELLRRWAAIRGKRLGIPQGEPGNHDGCLPQIDDAPGWGQIFLLRSYDAGSTEEFLASLSDHLSEAEITDLRDVLAAFDPRFRKVWKEMGFLDRFETRFRRFIDESDLRPFLGKVARFLGVDPDAFPAGRLHLMALPEEGATFATAIGRNLMMEIRPGDGPEEQIQVISHETTHYLISMIPPERLDALADQLYSSSPDGAVIWSLLREALPTAIGQGLSEARLAPRRFSLNNPWYHIAEIDRFAKAIYPVVEEAFREGRTIHQGVMERIAQGPAGKLAASSPPGEYLQDALLAVGSGMLRDYEQVVQRTPARHRWLFVAGDPAVRSFLDRYRCLGGLVLLGPGQAADPSLLPEPMRPAPRPQGQSDGAESPKAPARAARSGLYAQRRPGGGVLFYLVAAREADVERVADRFFSLRSLPAGPIWLSPPRRGVPHPR